MSGKCHESNDTRTVLNYISDPTPDNTVPTNAQQVFNDMAFEQELPETPAPQTAEVVDGQNVDSSARFAYQHYITGKNHHHSRISCL